MLKFMYFGFSSKPVVVRNFPPASVNVDSEKLTKLSPVVSVSGIAEALTSMGQSFALALIILYLLMAALFRSFKGSVLVVLTIPLATIGG